MLDFGCRLYLQIGDPVVFATAAAGVYFVGVGAFAIGPIASGSPTTYFVAATAPIACPSPPGPSSGIGAGTIVLYVFLGVAGLLALAGAVVWWQRRERKRSLSQGFAVLGDDVIGASAATNATELSDGSYLRLEQPMVALDS